MREPAATARRAAAIGAVITVLLAGTKAIVGFVAGSSALLADALHSTGDLFALGASWFGLTLAMRKPTDTFPHGFYRAETLAALACFGIILYLGWHLLGEGIERVREGTAEQAPKAYAAGDLE